MSAVLRQETDHAVRMLIELADSMGSSVPVKDIATGAHVTKVFAHKIVQKLRDAGVVSCSRGSSGGVELAKQPEDILLIDVIELIQGPLALSNCMDSRKSCPRQSMCRLCHGIAEVQSRLKDIFEGTTLATVIAEG